MNWKFFSSLIENAVYGGRIEIMLDVEILKAYLQMYFNQKIINEFNKNGIELFSNLFIQSFSTLKVCFFLYRVFNLV